MSKQGQGQTEVTQELEGKLCTLLHCEGTVSVKDGEKGGGEYREEGDNSRVWGWRYREAGDNSI